MKKQAEMFYEWDDLCESLKVLNVFMQNDLIKLLKDGYITPKDILKSFHEFSDLYHVRRKELDDLYNMIQLFHLSFLVCGGDRDHEDIIKKINNME